MTTLDAHTDPAAVRPLRLLLVDDHRVFSEALALALNLQEGIECIGVAPSVDEALRMASRTTPDVVLMDVRLPGKDGIEGTRRFSEGYPGVRVVVLTGHADPDVLARAAAAGAASFMPKESPLAEIVAAVRAATSGRMLIDGKTLAAILGRAAASSADAPRGDPLLSQLTPREAEVLTLMGDGLDSAEMAAQLNLSIHTCRGYVKSILTKLGAHSQLQAVVIAARRGFFPNLTHE